MPGMTPTVRQSARRKALLRVMRSLARRARWRCSLSIHSPERSVAWASQLPPPAVGEVRKALRDEYPASPSRRVPASSTAPTSANSGSSTASRP